MSCPPSVVLTRRARTPVSRRDNDCHAYPSEPGVAREPQRGGEIVEPIEQLACILPTIASVMDQIEPSQLDAPTPCEKFDVHGVLNHFIVLGGTFPALFRGEEPPVTVPLEKDGHVPAAECRKILDELLDAVRSPGAMERTIPTPVGDMPGAAFASFVAFDVAVHGWDLERSTGLRFELPSTVVEAVDQFARAALAPEMRDGDTFKAETEPPPGASALDRLAAFSGRTV